MTLRSDAPSSHHTTVARRGVLLAAALLAALPSPATAGAQATSGAGALPTPVIAQRATPATVTILALDAAGDTLGLGSGFFVRSSGVLVTNWHVMRGATRAVVLRENGERFERVTFMDGDEAADIAILKVPGYGLPVLEPRADLPPVGERVVAIGSPLGLSHTVSEGIVSARRVVDGRELVQMSAAISPGSSGGAVLDAAGRVFAVSTSYLDGGQQLNFAVPIRYALGLLSATITERPLAEAFGGQSRASGTVAAGSGSGARGSGASGARAPEESNERPGVAGPLPAAATSPRYPLDGVWEVMQGWFQATSGKEMLQSGYLYVTEHVGLLELYTVNADSSTGPTRVYKVDTWRATRDGQVAMSVSGQTYGGHQIGESWQGIALESEVRDEKAAIWDLRLYGAHRKLVISENSGLYDVSVPMQLTNRRTGRRLAGSSLYVGEAAVGFTDDDICVDLALSEAERPGERLGESIFGCAPFGETGRFEIPMGNGLITVKGTLRAGVMRATWTGTTDDTVLSGRLEAKRR